MASYKAPADWGGYKTYVEFEFYATTIPNDGQFRKKILARKCDMREWGEIYLLTCRATGQKYAGKAYLVEGGSPDKYRWWGTFRRFEDHLLDAKKEGGGNCTDLNEVIRKYGADQFDVVPLLTCRVADIPRYEKHFMDEYDTLKSGLNIRDPEECVRLPAVTCRRMSLAQSGEKHHQYGKARTPEEKAKISQTNIAKAIQNRKDFDGKTLLPEYMKKVNESNGAGQRKYGYKVTTHPTLKDKSCTSNVDSESERKRNYARCLEYLKTAA